MPAGVAGAGCGGAGDGVVGAEAGFGARFFRLCPFSQLRHLHPLLLSRRGTALCLLGFLRPVQYPDQIMPRRRSHLLSELNRTFALQKVMSALPPKAGSCSATTHVCFGASIALVRYRRTSLYTRIWYRRARASVLQ